MGAYDSPDGNIVGQQLVERPRADECVGGRYENSSSSHGLSCWVGDGSIPKVAMVSTANHFEGSVGSREPGRLQESNFRKQG